MFRQCAVALVFVMVSGSVARAEETATVEVHCAAEHVPADLKTGARVDLVLVTGKTALPNGKAFYSTSSLAKDIEVASVKTVEKPATPEQAVRVELRVTTAQAAKIEKAKSEVVTVTETTPGVQPKTAKKPVPLRLELVK